MRTCWDCDLQGPKGGIWAGEWASLGPFGALQVPNAAGFTLVHFGTSRLGSVPASRAKNELEGPFLGQSGRSQRQETWLGTPLGDSNQQK